MTRGPHRTKASTAAKTAPAAPKASVTDLAASHYAKLAARIPAVAVVATIPSDDGLSVWTLLNDDPAGRARQALYRLELVVFHEYPGAALDFRVITVDEFPEQRREELLPTLATTLFRRQQPPAAIHA